MGLKNFHGPFLIGLPRFIYVRPEFQKNIPENCIIVFADRNEIVDSSKKNGTVECPDLPGKLEDHLKHVIHGLAKLLTLPEHHLSRQEKLQGFRIVFNVISKLLEVTYSSQGQELKPNKNIYFLF